MSTPTQLRHAVENYFGGADQDIMREVLEIIDTHHRSPWIFSQDAQPAVGIEVICLDVNEFDASADVNTATRQEGSDWTDSEAVFWWMHIPPPPEGGAQTAFKSPETRLDAGNRGGGQLESQRRATDVARQKEV